MTKNGMNQKRLNRIKNIYGTLRNSRSIKCRRLQNLAKSLGRVMEKRGKEPTWVSPVFPDLHPVSIPCHSPDLKRFTAQSVLNSLEEDIERWEAWLNKQEEEAIKP